MTQAKVGKAAGARAKPDSIVGVHGVRYLPVVDVRVMYM